MGANAGGPEAAAAFVSQAAWHLDLARRSDGSFTYDGGEQYGPGKTDDNTYYGKSGYYGLSPDACYVLTYALPLRKLWITGKDANPKNHLTTTDVRQALASGLFYDRRESASPPELVAALSDWSPIVRGLAAEELAKRPEAKAMVPDLIAMVRGDDAWRRQGACEALGHIKDPQALTVLVRSLTHPDRWLRVKAAEALKRMGDKAKPVISDMLRAVVATAEPASPVTWEDPVQLTHGQLAAALFGGLLRGSIDGIDPKLLYPAIQAISRNADGMARATLNHTLADQLTLADVTALAPDILAAVRTRCPADTMFGNEIRMAGLKALAKYHFAEGIDAGIALARTQGGHGSESRTGQIMKLLVGYGKAAQPSIPQLRQLIVELNEQVTKREFPGDLNKRRVADVEAAITAIASATEQPELRSVTTPAPTQGAK
jgi:HEAT repeat protein